jgi:hypothetical protein
MLWCTCPGQQPGRSWFEACPALHPSLQAQVSLDGGASSPKAGDALNRMAAQLVQHGRALILVGGAPCRAVKDIANCCHMHASQPA